MKDEDVGVAVKGDDLGIKLVAQGGLDGEQTTYGEVLRVVGGGDATIHGLWLLLLILLCLKNLNQCCLDFY